jgi:hypothetical protein
MRLRVVAAVSEEHCWSAWRSSDNSADRWDRLYEWQQLGDVMCVGPGEQAGERYAVGVGDQVVLAAEFAPVNRTGPGLIAPKKRPQRGRVADSPGEVKAPGGAELGEQALV